MRQAFLQPTFKRENPWLKGFQVAKTIFTRSSVFEPFIAVGNGGCSRNRTLKAFFKVKIGGTALKLERPIILGALFVYKKEHFMQEKLQELRLKAQNELQTVTSTRELNDLKTKYTGKSGEITMLLRGMKDIAPEMRVAFGKIFNDLKEEVLGYFAGIRHDVVSGRLRRFYRRSCGRRTGSCHRGTGSRERSRC